MSKDKKVVDMIGQDKVKTAIAVEVHVYAHIWWYYFYHFVQHKAIKCPYIERGATIADILQVCVYVSGYVLCMCTWILSELQSLLYNSFFIFCGGSCGELWHNACHFFISTQLLFYNWITEFQGSKVWVINLTFAEHMVISIVMVFSSCSVDVVSRKGVLTILECKIITNVSNVLVIRRVASL